jgi:hypothetical protein
MAAPANGLQSVSVIATVVNPGICKPGTDNAARANHSGAAGPLVEILDVTQVVTGGEHFWGSHLDLPCAGQTFDSRALLVAGWALPRKAKNAVISVRFLENELANGELEVPRPDVARHFPRVAQSGRCGFFFPINLIGAAEEFTLQVSVIVRKGLVVPIGEIRGRQKPLCATYRPRLQPIIVTSLGRSGSTLVMRLLSAHPQILVLRQHPYEVSPLRYWLHVLSVLSARGDYQKSANPDMVGQHHDLVGKNPYHVQPVLEIPRLGEWLSRGFPDELAAFCLRNIETFYEKLEEAYERQGKGTRYFAEKSAPLMLLNLLPQLYSEARELVLVRDLRDVFCSVRSFNHKRGTVGFGYELVDSDVEYLRLLRTNGELMLAHWRERQQRSFLLHYEALITRPKETLQQVLEYLNLDSSPEILLQMVQSMAEETADLKQHRTVADPQATIGRWRRDLPARLQKICAAEWTDVLTALGYSAD